jgi:hypothetical protein
VGRAPIECPYKGTKRKRARKANCKRRPARHRPSSPAGHAAPLSFLACCTAPFPGGRERCFAGSKPKSSGSVPAVPRVLKVRTRDFLVARDKRLRRVCSGSTALNPSPSPAVNSNPHVERKKVKRLCFAIFDRRFKSLPENPLSGRTVVAAQALGSERK